MGESTGQPEESNEEMIRGISRKKLVRFAALGAAASFTFMAITTWLVFAGAITLSGPVRGKELVGYGLKAEFVFRYLILGVGWIIFCMFAVIKVRVTTPAVDPLNKSEHLTEATKNILINSIEQFIISMVTQLTLISYLSGDETTKVIPLLNLFFFVGRVTFFIGYPRYRTFGFMASMVPTFVAFGYTFYKFGEFLFA